MGKNLRLIVVTLLALNIYSANAQVSSYLFAQSNDSYVPIVANAGTTPADIFVSTWDDLQNATAITLPFPFIYNGTLHPTGTPVGIDTDAWIAFNPGTMTGNFAGGSWVSIGDQTGVYLNGTANNNGFSGFNGDLHHRIFTDIVGNLSSGSPIITNIAGAEFDDIRIGTRIEHANIPNGAVVRAFNTSTGTITMSANATANANNATLSPKSSIYFKTIGTSPNRQLVIQWTQIRRFGIGYENTDNFSFQMILNETSNSLQVRFGDCASSSATNLNLQVGLRGATSADFNARQSSTGWPGNIAATANNQHIVLNNTLAPSSGLTFTWYQCVTGPGNAGAISGSSPVCPNSNQTYTIPAVSGAAYYTWTYSGTGATFSATTSSPSNIFTYASNATNGTITVTPVNACGTGSGSTKPITLTVVSPASINYTSGPNFCPNHSPANVTFSGPAGGNYTSTPSGLTLNATTGLVTPSSSTSGNYTVSYNYSSNGCPVNATANVNIKPNVQITSSATPATICGSGNAQLNALADGGSSYSVSPISHNLLTPSGSPTVIYNSYTDDGVSPAIPLPFTFNYYGQSITQLFACTNGFIQLQNSTGSSLTPQTLPDATDPNNIIALAWDDLVLDPDDHPGANMSWFVNGASPNRVMVVAFTTLRFLGLSASTVTGQIRLYENDNHIEVHVMTDDLGNNYSKTLGIENNTGTLAVTPPGHNNTGWNATTPEGWSFTTSNYTYSWSPATFLNNTSISNPLATAVNATTNYTITVTNTTSGCINSANVNVSYNNPNLTSTTPGSRCGSGTVVLSATGSGNALNWYNVSSGGTLLFSGASYTTPIISSTTNYWVAAADGSVNTKTIGAGALTADHSNNVNPFRYYFGARKIQYLIPASELIAAGLTAGQITTLALDVVTAANTYNGLAISLKNTATTTLTGAMEAGTTQVYGPINYTPVAGINNFAATGFSWDGTSNLLIQFCWGNNNTGGTSSTTVRYDNVSGYSAYRTEYYDNYTSATICALTTNSINSSTRPKFIITANNFCEGTRTMVTATISPSNTWLGVDNNWLNTANWCPGVPTNTTDVTIPNGVANYPIITTATPVVRSIIIQNAANVTINSGGRLRVYGNINNAGTLTNNGTLAMTGSATQGFPGPGNVPPMNILEINTNTAATTAQLTKAITIAGELKLTRGVFNLSSFDVTLQSVATGTASVSAIGANASIAYGAGRFNVERYIYSARKWRFLSIPTIQTQTIKQAWQENQNPGLNGGPAGFGTMIGSYFANPTTLGFDFATLNGHDMKYWSNDASQTYIPVAQTSDAIATATGYMKFIRGDRSVGMGTAIPPTSTRLRTRGQLKTGLQTINFPALAINKFVAAGNPYASAIDMRNISRTNLSAMYYVWDPKLTNPVNGGNNGVGAFQLFTLQTSGPSNGNYTVFPGTGSYGPANNIDNNIESGAAFYLKTNAAGTSSISFNEASKTNGSRSVFRMGTMGEGAKLMNFLETFDDNAEPYILDAVMVDFGENYSNNVDGEDAIKFKNTGENLSIKKAIDELMLERHAGIIEADTIYLNIANMKVRNYRFNIKVENMNSAGLSAWMVDKFLQTQLPINLETGSQFNFNIENIAGSYAADRFMIVFKQATVVPLTFIDVAANWNNVNGIEINWVTENEMMLSKYEVERSSDGLQFNAIYNQQPLNTGARATYLQKDELPLAGINYYRIKAYNADGSAIYSKIVKVLPKAMISSITVYPNPVVERNIFIKFQNQPVGKYKAELKAADGKLILSDVIIITEENCIKKLSIKKHLAQGAYFLRLSINEEVKADVKLIVK